MVKLTQFLAFIILMNTAEGNVLFPYDIDTNKVRLINPTSDELYVDMEEKVQRVWEITKELTNSDSEIMAPVVVLEEFNQNVNQPEWVEFQNFWENWEGGNGEAPFNAKRLPGY